MNRTIPESVNLFLQHPDCPVNNSHLYDSSLHKHGEFIFFMVRTTEGKRLVVLTGEEKPSFENFSGELFQTAEFTALVCPLHHQNAVEIRSRFPFTRPVLIGKNNSYGLGDRLGNAGVAHLRAIKKSDFRPVLAQQSIRELERTSRTATEVMDAALWAVFQEGYHEGFGADGDHLKNSEHLDRMVKAGYTMFTIDPSEFVNNSALDMEQEPLNEAYASLPWNELNESPDELLERLSTLDTKLANGFVLTSSESEVKRGMVKYGRVILHTVKMARYLFENYPDHPAELELSVDETDYPTTLFEHFLIASELQRLGVDLVSLAPRFCGDFEKGIDFKGDLNQFREEYEQHLAIAERFGGYKLSIHSGSDKFSVYEVVGSLKKGAIHVKTAGTSYLEAIRTVAASDEDFFREILRFGVDKFETDKKTYHISADLEKVPDPAKLSGNELIALLDDNHVRQVLHVTYGSVLSGEDPRASTFKKRLMDLLYENEELYDSYLARHFERHLSPFG